MRVLVLLTLSLFTACSLSAREAAVVLTLPGGVVSVQRMKSEDVHGHMLALETITAHEWACRFSDAAKEMYESLPRGTWQRLKLKEKPAYSAKVKLVGMFAPYEGKLPQYLNLFFPFPGGVRPAADAFGKITVQLIGEEARDFLDWFRFPEQRDLYLETRDKRLNIDCTEDIQSLANSTCTIKFSVD